MRKFMVQSVIFLSAICGAGATGTPTHLRVNFIPRPLGLDATNANNLRFGWRVPNGMQTAYQIQVGNGWDSGKVVSKQENGILYRGPALKPKTVYPWKVRIWIDGRETAWAESVFETGILNPNRDWTGKWVGKAARPLRLMRQSFNVPPGKKVVRARAYVAARHNGRTFFAFRVNGVRPGNCYQLRYGIFTFDVTPCLKPGENVFGIMFGHIGGLVICDVDLWFDDGSRLTVGTGPETRGSPGGPVLKAHEFDGEVYDARKETAWCKPGFDARGWQTCTVANARKPGTAILDLPKTVEIINPKPPQSPQRGVYVFDAGTQISGWQILKINTKAGTCIRFRFAERLNKDGTIDRSTILKGLPAQQIDVYTCKDGDQIWEPQLTFHGFRYMEVTGLPTKPTPETIRFRRVAADVCAEVATFACSNESLNRIHRAFHDTELANAFLTQTDCNQRGERAPWAADAYCVSEAAMSYFDMAYFWQEKWINIANTRVGPHGESNSILNAAGGGYGLLWGSHCVRIPWDYWIAYGDLVYLEPGYKRSKKFADCCINWYDALDDVTCKIRMVKRGKRTIQQPGKIIKSGNRKDWLIDSDTKWRSPDGKVIQNPMMKYGDWVRPDGIKFTRTSFINSAAYYLCVKRTAQMAEALGKTKEAAYYRDIAGKVRAAINAKWLVEKGGTTYYLDNDQTPNAMALHYGIVPAGKRKAIVKSLVDHIRKCGNHVSTGAIGTLSLIPALSQNGRDDVVFDLAVQKTLPSWIGMLDIGPGTFWEHWKEKGMSKCHPFLGGSIAAWLHQVVAGIKPAKPGYEEIKIRPTPVGDLTFCKTTIPTVRGPISVDWELDGTVFRLKVVIPGNCTAKVYLPGVAARTVGPGTHDFQTKMK